MNTALSIIAFLQASASLLSLGTSPLVEEGHTHAWIEIGGQYESDWPEEGRVYDEKWYYDQAWTKSVNQDGQVLPLILIRSAVDDPEGQMKGDAILAVSCVDQKLGLKEAYAFVAPYGQGNAIRNDPIEMHPLRDDPLIKDSKRLIDIVCDRTVQP
ncbi:MAG: hypothetical protein ABJ242_01005 [Marinomonas sp.]